MVVNQGVLDTVFKDAEEIKMQRAKQYKNLGRIEITNVDYEDDKNFEVKSIVTGTEKYNTYLYVKNGEIEDTTCDCKEYQNSHGICRHTLASFMEFSANKNYINVKENKKTIAKKEAQDNFKYRAFKQIVTTFFNEEIDNIHSNEVKIIKKKDKVRIEPRISYDKFSGDMKVEFRIGNRKMYKIKSLPEFYTHILNEEFFRYGEKLQFIHTKEIFEEESKQLLEFLLKYSEIIKYANSNSNSNYRYYGKALSETSIILSNSGIDEIFEVLKGKKIDFQRDYNKEKIEFTNQEPDIGFSLKKINEEEFVVTPNIEIFDVVMIQGKTHKYILTHEKLYQCTKQFEDTNLKLLEIFRKNYMTEVIFSKQELNEFFSIIMPKMKDRIKLEDIEEEEIETYKPKKLQIKVFLDFDKKDYLVADVKFIYGENEFNPLDETIKIDFPRNKIKETQALNILRNTGFMLDTKNLRFILPNDDKIYDFLTRDIELYMKEFEVLATEKFKTKQIRQPKVGSLGVKVENNLLSIDLQNLDIDARELEEIIAKYTIKKKYHRLKDGSFINLEENKEIDFLNKLITGMDIDYKQLETGEVNLPVHRSLYLNQLLKQSKVARVSKNDTYKSIVNGLDKEHLEEDAKVPENLEHVLRYYQKTGFKWLKVLDSYKFRRNTCR